MGQIKARALWFTGPGKVGLKEELISPEPGQVFTKSSCIGISAGSEMLFFNGDFPEDLPGDTPGQPETYRYPLKYGYSNAGVTRDGKRVFGFYPHQDRWFADPDSLINLPDTIDDETACFIPNTETAMGIVQALNPRPGDSVLVMGLGVVGQLVARILNHIHYGRTIVCDPDSFRREKAVGSSILAPEEKASAFKEQIREHNSGRLPDKAVNVSGNGQALNHLIQLMPAESEILEASWYGKKLVNLDLGSQFHRKQLRIRSFQVSNLPAEMSRNWTKSRRMELVLEILPSLMTETLVSHRYTLTKAVRVFDLISEGSEPYLQILIKP